MQEASISVLRNRLKVYPGNQVYLKDGQEFEIELFNPSTVTRLAKISINGSLISQTGLVLKPGQRVYLERFIDKPDKFKFETYSVQGNSKEVEKAIALNGKVEVSFYDEYVQPIYTPPHWTSITTTGYPSTFTSTSGFGGNVSSYFSNTSNSSKPLTKSSLGAEKLRSRSAAVEDEMGMLDLAEKETGRVEAGSKSDQSFTNYQGSFNYWTSAIVSIKILPLSEKPLEVSDLANFCGNCGTKNKGNKFKFCPTCGNKY